jgi:hypothetical protein
MDQHADLASEIAERLEAAGFDVDEVRQELVLEFLEDELGLDDEEIERVRGVEEDPDDNSVFALGALCGLLTNIRRSG